MYYILRPLLMLMPSKKKKPDKEWLLSFLEQKAKHLTKNATKWELSLKDTLLELKYHFKMQVPVIFENKRTIKGYILDFLLPDYQLVIEVDGKQYHSSKEQIKNDNRRTKHLKSMGYDVLRFTNSQITNFTKDHISKAIKAKIDLMSS